jgi:23S rRNA (guanosine2251-2'-O)-methyltransferase
MIIRSAVAAGVDGLLYPKKGVAALGPLVIKASAGTVFRAPLILSDALGPALQTLKNEGYAISTLEASAPQSLFSYRAPARTVFVLGGETSGVSDAVTQLADQRLAIPMSNEVESLNVAVTAALVAFHLTTSPE